MDPPAAEPVAENIGKAEETPDYILRVDKNVWEAGELPHRSSGQVDFVKRSRWSPEGSCLLSFTEGRKLLLHEPFRAPAGLSCDSSGIPALSIAETDVIHDISWYQGCQLSTAVT